ncbi:c-type cytochrome [Azospirillum picis]|uniref:Cytochrome c556 n=1 Tax=Azospirillum picis TaxID=488438 RepID=A0ABU0MPC3_9PROT|nr:cytochrome c [Azospirillum picis]MBP2301263.1 cytochrome c556 [Azospirillum picis]MDQ0535094.1 cytochrome c556 [Azospirillum picis]
MNNRVVNVLAATSVAGLLFALFGLSSGTAGAADPAAQVKERQQTMKAMGGGLGAVAKYVKGEGATAEDASKGVAALVAASGKDPKAVFPEGTEVGVGDSAAKPELWKNWSKAQSDWGAVQPAAQKLQAALQGGDRAQVAQALAATSKTCGGCHEDFRIKKN